MTHAAVRLSAFGIDRTEVTVFEYDRCVIAGRCNPSLVMPGAGQFGGNTQPMVGVTFDEAVRYCAWVGGRLPTEAEWERAARGRDGRIFPWGNQFDPRRTNGGALTFGCTSERDGYGLTAPVGSFRDGASPEGALDMAGNAREWVSDAWDTAASRYVRNVRLSQPRGPSVVASEHVVRGGSYRSASFMLRTTWRDHVLAGERDLTVGFRCAYDVR